MIVFMSSKRIADLSDAIAQPPYKSTVPRSHRGDQAVL